MRQGSMTADIAFYVAEPTSARHRVITLTENHSRT